MWHGGSPVTFRLRDLGLALCGLGGVVLLAVLVALALDRASNTPTTDEALHVTIESPADGEEVQLGTVTVSGTASAGLSTSQVTGIRNVLYVVDDSDSSQDQLDCNGDQIIDEEDDANGNLIPGEGLDCEILSVLALNDSLQRAAHINAGLVRLTGTTSTPAAHPGAQSGQIFAPLTTDQDGDGARDIDEVARTLTPTGATSADAGLTTVNSAFAAQPAGDENVAFLLVASPGITISTGASSPVQDAVDAGTVVNTYSIGPNAPGCKPGSSLATIAAATGGSCTLVVNPTALSAIQPSAIASVEVALDGNAPVPAMVDAHGDWIAEPGSITESGPHLITATVRATDGTTHTAESTVRAPNRTPIADDLSLSTPTGTPVPVTLSGTDSDGDPLAFAIADGPTHGTLTGQPPNLTYTPDPDDNGLDSFTFEVSDPHGGGDTGTVAIDVLAAPGAPTANDQSLTAAEGIPVPVTLSGTDPDGEPLTIAVAAQPSHGTLAGDPPTLTYTPSPGYLGADFFTFTVADPSGTRDVGRVSIDVVPTPDTPTAIDQTVIIPSPTRGTPTADDRALVTREDIPVPFSLSGADADGAPVAFAISGPPSHGIVSGSQPNLIYTPAPNYHGRDSFTFTVTSPGGLQDTGTVSITVSPANDPPSAVEVSLTIREDTPRHLSLTGGDPDGDAVSFAVLTQPSHGTLTGRHPVLLYTPSRGYHGPDSFTFSVTDTTGARDTATVSINVTSVNDPPSAADVSLTTQADTPVPVLLSGTDPDGGPVSITISGGPANGTLTGSQANQTYTPNPGFSGTDSFNFSVTDAAGAQDTGTVTVTVTPPPPPPEPSPSEPSPTTTPTMPATEPTEPASGETPTAPPAGP